MAHGNILAHAFNQSLPEIDLIVFSSLSGRLPFESNTPWGYMHKHINEPPPPLRTVKPSVPEEIERIVMRCLEKEPENGYQSALAVKETWTRRRPQP